MALAWCRLRVRRKRSAHQVEATIHECCHEGRWIVLNMTDVSMHGVVSVGDEHAKFTLRVSDKSASPRKKNPQICVNKRDCSSYHLDLIFPQNYMPKVN